MCTCRMFVNCFPNITITNAPLLSCLAVSEELFRHTINAAVCWSQVSHVQRLPWFRLSGCQYRLLFCPTKRYMVVGAFFFFTPPHPTPLLSHRVNLLTFIVSSIDCVIYAGLKPTSCIKYFSSVQWTSVIPGASWPSPMEPWVIL